MAEAEARREARRKRILENSERRLLKITGLIGEGEGQEDTEALRKSDATEPGSSQTDHSDRSAHDAITDDRQLTGSYDNWNEVRATSNSFRVEGTRRWTRPDERNGNAHDGTDDALSSSKLFFPSALLSNRVYYVLLAILVNALLIMRVDHLFGKTISVSYFTMVLVRVVCSNPKEENDGVFLVAALILCNVRPEVTYRLKRLMAMINIALGDLALYIFSFTLMYCGISYYWPELNSQTTSDAIEREL